MELCPGMWTLWTARSCTDYNCSWQLVVNQDVDVVYISTAGAETQDHVLKVSGGATSKTQL